MLTSGKLSFVNRSVVRACSRLISTSNYIVLGDDQKRKEIENAVGKKVLYFTASWCPPCKMIAPIFEKISKENTSTTFLKIDIDDFTEAASEYNVRSVPTFVFLDGKRKVSQFAGASEADLKANLKKLQE